MRERMHGLAPHCRHPHPTEPNATQPQHAHLASPAAVDLEFVGKSPCPKLSTAEIVQQLGYHAVPQASIANLARDALRNGLCTKPPYMAPTYTGWLKDVRGLLAVDAVSGFGFWGCGAGA